MEQPKISVLEQSLRATSTLLTPPNHMWQSCKSPSEQMSKESSPNPAYQEPTPPSLHNQGASSNQAQHQPPPLPQNNPLTASPTLVPVQTFVPTYPTTDHPSFQPGPNMSHSDTLQLRYNHLLAVIREMSSDLKPLYAGSSRVSSDRFKRGISQAKLLVKECLIESERAVIAESTSK